MRTDTELAAFVANILKWHVAVDEKRIEIEVKDGVVTLEGTVNWDFQRQDVEKMVRCLPDVRRLDNFININTANTTNAPI
jgi:osmotically-inducible protein OsmY